MAKKLTPKKTGSIKVGMSKGNKKYPTMSIKVGKTKNV